MKVARSIVLRPGFYLPLIVFALVAAFFAVGLQLNPQQLPSTLIGKSAPSFQLPVLYSESENFTTEQMKGEPWMLNGWASWCIGCAHEHNTLVYLSKQNVKIVGLNYKDKPEEAKGWLEAYENPYVAIPVDPLGEHAIDWGISKLPETFVIDASGVVVYKHTGPIDKTTAEEVILPLIRKAGS